MPLGILFTIPDGPTFLANLGSTSSPIVTDFLPVIYVVGGIALAVFIVVTLVLLFTSSHKSK